MGDSISSSAEAHNKFLQESFDNLEELESALLDGETSVTYAEAIDRIFRVIHSLKGSAGMFGFREVSDFLHNIENVYTLIQHGTITPPKNLFNLTLKVHDLIRNGLLIQDGLGGNWDADQANLLSKTFEKMVPESFKDPEPPPTQAKEASSEKPIWWDIRCRFDTNKPILAFATNPKTYLQTLKKLGTCHISPQLDLVPTLKHFNPEVCYIYWNIFLKTTASETEIRQTFEFIEDDLSELSIERKINTPAITPTLKKSHSQRFLIADDLLPNRLLLHNYLRDYASCDIVADGLEAVEMVEISLDEQTPYDLILMDIMMPEMDGIEAVRLIRAMERALGVKPSNETIIIMISALNSPHDVMNAFRKTGCTDYIAKPVLRDKLLNKLRQHNITVG